MRSRSIKLGAIGAMLVVFVGVAYAGAAKTVPAAEAKAAVEAHMFLGDLLREGDDKKISEFYKDVSNPSAYRARAFEALFRNKKAPLRGAERALIVSALKDSGSEVRLIAARLVGKLKETMMVRQVLQLVVDDPDPKVRTEALVAVRPWTRMTHLFFLEKALEDESVPVRVEGVNSIAQLKVGALAPAIVGRIESLPTTDKAPEVRWAAMDALLGWNRLTWNELRDTIMDTSAPESLRIHAIELTDMLPQAQKIRIGALRDIVVSESSLYLVWNAFKRVRSLVRGDNEVNKGLAALLSGTALKNTATVEMASHLASHGLTVERKDDGWLIRGI